RMRAAAQDIQDGDEAQRSKTSSQAGDTSVKHEFVATAGWEARDITKVALTEAGRSGASEFEVARRYFNAHRAQIVEQYEGQYVAILNDEIVDYDRNWEDLSERTYRTF